MIYKQERDNKRVMSTSTILIISDSNEFGALLGQHPVLEDVVFSTCDRVSRVKIASCRVIVVNKPEILDSVCSLLIKNKADSPIIDLTDEVKTEDVSTNGNVYRLPKPYHLSELFSLLERCIQKTGENRKLVMLGQWQFDAIAQELCRGKKVISLTEKETSIIQLLYDAQPNAVDKKELLEQVWGYSEAVDTHTLETHIYRLRQKFGDDKGVIATGDKGYMLCNDFKK